MSKIGIVVIATNAYCVLGIRFLKKFIHHYKGNQEIKFFFFTEESPSPYLPNNIDVEFIPEHHDNWIDGTNSKFKNIVSLQNSDVDYLYYFDADTNVDRDFTEQWFLHDLVGGEHYANNQWMVNEKGFDRNPESAAYIPIDTPLPQMYYYGAFFGGSKDKVIAFCNVLINKQLQDKQINYEPAVNDESYINNYFHYHPPSLTVATQDFVFLISDKGGLGETRNSQLDVGELKNQLLSHKNNLIDIRDGVMYDMGEFQSNYTFTIHPSAIIHPTVILSDKVHIGENVQIGPYCSIGLPPEWKGKENQNKGVIIKKNTILTGYVTIDGGAERITEIGENGYIMKHSYIAHDCIIGDNVTISAGTNIAGLCTVENNVTLGMGVAIHQKSNIPYGIMIGMNGVVIKKSNLLPNQKYAGVPVRHIGSNQRTRITISIACYGRPERTKRAIQCIMNQDINGWEAFIMGDCCPDFQNLIDSGYLEQIKIEQAAKGNTIHYFNAEINGGGWGNTLINYAIQHAKGNYFCLYANDDIILPNHFRHYLSEIENTSYDMVYYNSKLVPLNDIRNTVLNIGTIAHCDIIVKTSAAKSAPEHNNSYQHDWDFINYINNHGKCKKSDSQNSTYHVMSLPSHPPIDTID